LRQILLINPNSSVDTTKMMVGIAQACDPAIPVTGITATRSPPMILTAAQLAAAADEVIEIGTREAANYSGIVISAFGDPGIVKLLQNVGLPVVGICEGAMIEAAAGNRRFGVATVTPDLTVPIAGRARDLNLSHLYTGIRLTPGDPFALARDPERLRESLAVAVAECLEKDKAEAVIIGGGPLGQAAIELAPMFKEPVIAPIPAAMRRLLAMM
jgi:Asp/Glu/hydantoin racemase